MKFMRLSLFLLLAMMLATAMSVARAQPVDVSDVLLEVSENEAAATVACNDGTQGSGALYQICMPNGSWNGELVLYAHGYVSPYEPLSLPGESTLIATIINLQGRAFATTSYSTNGLAIRQGMADVVDLIDVFTAQEGAPSRVFLMGFSEGGIITTLTIENHPELFAGGLSMCGPTGSFARQTSHFGDFRILFDYFFPSLMPGEPIDIPQSLIDDWDNHYTTVIEPEVTNPTNEGALSQLFAVSGAAYDVADPATRSATTEGLLWYNVFSTNDGVAKLGGQPYDNQNRIYAGSDDDMLLNNSVPRYSAEMTPTVEIATYYETTGEVSVPLVTMHTTGDHIIPYWHAELYYGRSRLSSNPALHEHIEVDRYGHCTFDQTEILGAFDRMVALADNPPPLVPLSRTFIPLFNQ